MNPIEPTQVWSKEEWEALDFREMPKSPLRDLIKMETFIRIYRTDTPNAADH